MLKENEAHFYRVISSISDHIYVTEIRNDGSGLNHYISPNVEPLTGYQASKFKDDWLFWQSIIHSDDREIASSQLDQFAKGQNSEVEYRLIKADNNIIWVRDSGQVETGPSNRWSQFMV